MGGSLGSATIAEVLDRQVVGYGDRPFVTFYDESRDERVELSYGGVDKWAHKTANLLAEELGVGQGDRVGIVAGTHWQAEIIQLACWRVGACAVPVDPDEPAAGKAAILKATGSAVAFVREEWLDDLRSALDDGPALVALCADAFGNPAVDLRSVPNFARVALAMPDRYDGEGGSLYDPALVVLAAGHAPEGVALTQTDLLTRAAAITERWRVNEGDRIMGTLPDHDLDGVVTTLLVPLGSGAGTVVQRRFNAGTWWKRVADERVTVADLTSVEAERLLDAGVEAEGLDRHRLRLVAYEGGPPPEPLAAGWRERLGMPLSHWGNDPRERRDQDEPEEPGAGRPATAGPPAGGPAEPEAGPTGHEPSGGTPDGGAPPEGGAGR